MGHEVHFAVRFCVMKALFLIDVSFFLCLYLVENQISSLGLFVCVCVCVCVCVMLGIKPRASAILLSYIPRSQFLGYL
jgi:hypothetical protein